MRKKSGTGKLSGAVAAALLLAGCFVPSVSAYAPPRTQPAGEGMVLVAPETFVVEGKQGVGLPPSVNGRFGVADGVDLGLRGGMGGARLDVKGELLRSRFVDVAVAPNASWGPYTTTRTASGRGSEEDRHWVHSHYFGLPVLLGLNLIQNISVVGNAGVLLAEDRDALTFDDRLVLEDGFALHFGGGMSFRLGPRVHFQPELSAVRFLDQRGHPWIVQVGIGIGNGVNPYRDAGFDAEP